MVQENELECWIHVLNQGGSRTSLASYIQIDVSTLMMLLDSHEETPSVSVRHIGGHLTAYGLILLCGTTSKKNMTVFDFSKVSPLSQLCSHVFFVSCA